MNALKGPSLRNRWDEYQETHGKPLNASAVYNQYSSIEKEIKAELEKTNNVDAAAYLGTVIAKRAIEAGINTVVFDRGGFIYQGKIKALADAAREAGLEF